ncbi:metallophosphoesterase [Fusibacter sp. 3D3]|uniref:metallophosphoesterase n=1 Tax=Fusibacter sp. 3D3 TaxID=1048380 RepID=UPI000853B127|nr:metallophosphoesterase [Fusibacter sp. 3D3]GAU79129.1 hypothetical protein F3D3_3767 [Fusibacter sp. 3D3]
MNLRKRIAVLCLVLMVALSTFGVNDIVMATDDSSIFIEKDKEWKYLDNGIDLGTTWREVDFDDSTWKVGKAPLGYGDDFSETDPTLPLATKVSFGDKAEEKYMTTYLRGIAEIDQIEKYSAVEVYIHVDDSAVVYVNGIEAFRRGIDETEKVVYSTTGKFKPKEEILTIPISAFKKGQNSVAVEVHQDGGDSSDLWFEMSMKGVQADKTILEKDAEWLYLDNGKDLGKDWTVEGYDESSWKTGKSPFGYGDDFSETDPTLPLATQVGYGTDAENKHMTTYFRKTIDVGVISGYSALETYIHVDDGAVVYVNGKELFRKGIDENVAVEYGTKAKFKPKEETLKIPVSALKDGKNTIAVEVHQDGGDSSDLWFEMSIKALSGASASEKEIVVPDPNAVKGEVQKVTVTFLGDTTSAKGFTWYTTLASANSDVQVVEQTSGQPDFQKALKFKGDYTVSTHAPNFPLEVVHKANVTGLKASTTYAYRVGDESLNLWSDIGTFETAASTGSFTFIDIADTQAKSEDESILSGETIKKAFETVKDAKFIAINGDIVDTGLNEVQWDNIFKYTKDSFMNTTILPVAGNHEEQKNSFIEHFNVPSPIGASTETGAYYSVDYAGTHFIILNTNEDSKEFADLTPSQVDWLKLDAKAAKAAGAKWIILIMHKGPYTTSNHASDDDIMDENGVRTLIAPLLAELDVDFVLQGHDHIYARTLPIADGKAVTSTVSKRSLNGKTIDYYNQPDGTIYMIPATAGPKVYYKNKELDSTYYDLFALADENHAATYGPDASDSSRPVRGQIQNFVGITVDADQLTAVVYEIDQSKNEGKPYIVDQFGISKASVTSQTTYTVVPGDALWKIAKRYGTTVEALFKANMDRVKNPNLIQVGQSLVLPN